MYTYTLGSKKSIEQSLSSKGLKAGVKKEQLVVEGSQDMNSFLFVCVMALLLMLLLLLLLLLFYVLCSMFYVLCSCCPC